MKFNLTINDIEKSELTDVIKALAVINNSDILSVEMCQEDNVVADSNENDDVEELAQSDDVISFDKEGLPWDERIHSSNKKLTAKGVWQRRKNIEDSYYESVKNELLGVAPVSSVADSVAPYPEETPAVVDFTNPTTIPFTTPVVAPVTLAVEQPFTPQAVEAPVAPVAPVPLGAPKVAPVDCATLYQEMFEKVKTGFGSRLLDANYIQGVIATHNATTGKSYKGLAEMKDDADALKFVINDLVAKGL